MGSRQYIVPLDEMTLSDIKTYKMQALAAGIKRSYERKIASWDAGEIVDPGAQAGVPSYDAIYRFMQNGGWPAGLDVRDMQPILDAATALDQWNTAALAAVGTAYSCFQAVAAPAIGQRANKIVVFYGIAIETSPLPISRLTFRRNTAAGTIVADFDLEPLAVMDKMVGLFSEPVVWDENSAYAMQALCRIATGAAARVIPLNFVFEPAGQTHQ